MRRGTSLIEMIFAISLIGLIVLFLFGLIPSAGLLGRQAEQQLSATDLAKEIDAHLGSVAFQTLKTADGKVLNSAAPEFLENVLEERELSDRTVLRPEVALRSLPPNDRLIQATITVRWRTREKERVYTLVKRYSSVLR